MQGRDGTILQADLLSGQNGRINESPEKRKKLFTLLLSAFFLLFFLNTSHFDSAAPLAERTRSSLLSPSSSIRVRCRGARRSPDTDHPSSGCCGHRRGAEPSPEGCAHEGRKEVRRGGGGGIFIHEAAGTISQRRLSGSPVCQADGSCALIRERRCRWLDRSKKKGKKNEVAARPLTRRAPLRLANGDWRAQELL